MCHPSINRTPLLRLLFAGERGGVERGGGRLGASARFLASRLPPRRTDGRTDLLAVPPPPLNAFAAIVGSAAAALLLVLIGGPDLQAQCVSRRCTHRGVKCTAPLCACLDHLFPVSVYSGTPNNLSVIQPEGK